ncbi:MAG: RNA methyltransferase [Pseudomonadota bacterium]
MNSSNPCIILVRPQMGENIGASARAMLNFNLTDMRIVAPRDGWPNQAATDNASGAFDIIQPQIFENLKDALVDCHYSFATTARIRDMVKSVYTPQSAMEDVHQREQAKQKIALVFGPERTGLENDDLALCNSLINVPTNADFSSLNLSQCVLLMAYAWKNASIQKSTNNIRQDTPANHEKLEKFFSRMETELDDAGFFRDEGLKPTMKRNIRNMFMRAEMTDQEVQTFHGIISALIGKKNRK